MKQINRWAVATRTQNGGPWHLMFSRRIFAAYENAAKEAFKLNEGAGYLHKPVRVTVEAEEIHIANLKGYAVGETLRIRNGRFRVTRLEEGSLWVGLEEVLPPEWDGLFVGGLLIWKQPPQLWAWQHEPFSSYMPLSEQHM